MFGIHTSTPRSDRARAAINRFAWRDYANDDPRSRAPPTGERSLGLPLGGLDFRTVCPKCGRLHYAEPYLAAPRGYVSLCGACYLGAVRAFARDAAEG